MGVFLQRAARWMFSRYGMDEFSKFLMVAGLVLALVSGVFSLPILNILGLALSVYGAVRIVSTERTKRTQENQFYLQKKRKAAQTYHRWKNALHQRKVYKFYKCPSCSQKLRVPKGKKKIKITCPNCKEQFVKKT